MMMMPDLLVHGPEHETKYSEKTFVEILQQNLAKHGDSTAFVDGETGEILTHKAFHEKSMKVATALRYIGLQKGDIVAMISENHINYWIPQIACLYNGLIVHHISPTSSNYELAHLLKISKPKIIFTNNMQLDKALWCKQEYAFIKAIILLEANKTTDIIDLDILVRVAGCLAMEDTFKPEILDDPKTQVAAIFNSSGTTGLPKGVMTSHDNFKSMLYYQSHPDYFNLSPKITTIVNLPFCHLYGGVLGLGSLTLGMKGIVMAKFKYDKYLSLIEQYKATNLYLAPPMVLFMAKNEIIDNYDLSSLKDVFCGAAPLGVEIEQLFQDRIKVNIRQLYGFTEGCLMLIHPSCGKPHRGSSGLLVPGSTAKVIDIATKQSLGPNQTGEICFKGDSISLGYLHNQEATDELIDDEAFAHSGDIGYYDEEGYFYIVDRLKDLIKYKGFQVAPGELEDVLKSHKNIKDAGVLGVPDERAGELAMAFIVREADSNITAEEIINYVASIMSPQKHLYGGVTFIEEIPKNATGKILKNKLRKLL